jgi:hypothetical protein
MLILGGLVLGGLWGANLARKRKGSRLDIAQYAAGFAIAFAIVGLFATVLIDRFA